MEKIENSLKQLSQIWQKFQIEGYLNIYKSKSKEISFTPVGDEILVSEDSDINLVLNIIKNNKKLTIKLNSISYEDLCSKIEDNLGLLDVGTADSDIYLYPVKNILDINEIKFDIDEISGDFLLKQRNKVKNFEYASNISIEGFSYSLNVDERYFINSLGAFKSHKSSQNTYFLGLYYNTHEFSDTEYEVFYSSNCELVTSDFISKTQDKLLSKINPQTSKLNSGIYNVTFKNNLAGDFLDILLSSVSGEKIRQGISFIKKDDIGKKIVTDKLNIKSIHNIDNSPFNRFFDSEGIDTEDITIIKNGVLSEIFLDSKNAKKYGKEPVGNPTYANIELIGDKKNDFLKNSSFLFTNLMGLHTIDYSTGKFALEGEGFEINNSKIGNFIKNVSISGNILDLFGNIESFGNDIYEHSAIKSGSITFKNQQIII
ncbi:TldD/PmbA family protein [Candidatus Gracilibacteria bacterium]|nr:TldD/PmbA family protein [Candidatus Gracilibacteria bacterium]